MTDQHERNAMLDDEDDVPVRPVTSHIQQAMVELNLTLKSKNQDYRIDGEFSNFDYAAKVSGYLSPQEVMLTQIGIKLGRLQGLPRDPNNESRLDTLKDLAGYAIILYAHALSLADEADPFS